MEKVMTHKDAIYAKIVANIQLSDYDELYRNVVYSEMYCG